MHACTRRQASLYAHPLLFLCQRCGRLLECQCELLRTQLSRRLVALCPRRPCLPCIRLPPWCRLVAASRLALGRRRR